MELLVDSQSMKQCDKNTIEHFGILSMVLMERAALGVFEEIAGFFENSLAGKKALVVCGFGNNGGDGLAVARMIWQKGVSVAVVMPPGPGTVSKETEAQKNILDQYQIPIVSQIPEAEYDFVVDALFGIGLSRELRGIYRDYVTKMNQLSAWKVAVDIPSGIDADTGAVLGAAFLADVTVSFAFAKTGLLLFPGAEYAGKVVVKEIGIDKHSFLEQQPSLYRLTLEDLKEIPSRKARSNKGSYGKALVAAGQKNMAGAAFFSAKSAYLTGAGLVKVVTAEENRVILQQLLPEAILETYQELDIVQRLSVSLEWASVIVAGPGIGTGEAACLIEAILSQAKVPVILDADGLNIVSKHLEWLKNASAQVIVTPHLGEMARLVKQEISVIQQRLIDTARQFAKEYQVICVLKDARTVTALPDGRTWINTSGNNGMATAGAGDVLTGVIAGLIAQGMNPEAAAPMAVYLHGMAGDRQAQEKGAYGLTAQDIMEGIPYVLKDRGTER